MVGILPFLVIFKKYKNAITILLNDIKNLFSKKKDNMSKIIPTSEQIQKLANKVRNGAIVQILTGKDLLKPNLERKFLLDDHQHDTIDVGLV
jgi:hypothetical protein